MAKHTQRCIQRHLLTSLHTQPTRFFSTYVQANDAKEIGGGRVGMNNLRGERGDKDGDLASSIESKLGFSCTQDWYALSKDQVNKMFGTSFRYITL